MSAGVAAAESNVETEKLVQYQELTGVDDITQCRRTLERHGWNVEAAVLATFNEADGMQHASLLQEEEDMLAEDHLMPPDEDLLIANADRRPAGLLEWGRLLLFVPFQWILSMITEFLDVTRRFLRPPALEDRGGDVVKFCQFFNQKYGVQHPPFYQGTYSQAINDAKKELKFLFVYLHSRGHQDTDEFCRTSLSSQNVMDIINTNGLFWACDVESCEGYKVSRALRESRYPFIAVIVLKNGQMTIVSRIEGYRSADELSQALVTAVTDNEAFVIAARAERDERSFNQSLRQEQDQAYQQSLLADQEKVRLRQAEEERQLQAQQQLQIREQEAAAQRLAVARQRAEAATKVPEEPPESAADCIRVLLKMPSGARLERRFLKTQSIKILYFYVSSHQDAPVNFQITTNFPRRVLACEPSSDVEPETFEALGFGKSEMLFVHDTDA